MGLSVNYSQLIRTGGGGGEIEFSYVQKVERVEVSRSL